MLRKQFLRFACLFLALGVWLLGPDAPGIQHIPLLGTARVQAQAAIPAPTRARPTGDCSVDNIYYGAIPPGHENGRVIVFVHGYSGLASDWWTAATTAGLNDMYALAYTAGYRTAFVNTNIDLKKPPKPQNCLITTRKTSYDMFNNGGVVAKQIVEIVDHYGVPQLDVVAHSKGGTDAQTAIVWFGSWRYVRNLFTLATPHQGSLLADLVWTKEGISLGIFIGNLDRATLSMRTPIMQLYRLFTDLAKSDDYVEYYSGAGNFWDLEGSAYEITGAWLQDQPKGGDNDGGVTVASTSLPYAKPLFLEGWTHTQVAIGSNSFPYIDAVLQADFTAPAGIELAGPLDGTLGRSYEFAAYVPITVTRPVSFTWTATDQSIVQSLNDTSSSSKVTFVWNTPGTKRIEIAVSNGAATVVTTHEIQISAPTAPANLALTGESTGSEKTTYTFNAAVPSGTTTPVVYTWHATDQIGIEKSGNTLDSLALTWTQPGRKVIEVVATNSLGSVTATHVIFIGAPTVIDGDTPMPPDPTASFPNKLYIAQVATNSQAAAQASSIDTLTDEERAQLAESSLILRGGEVAVTSTEQLPIEPGTSSVKFLLLASDPSVQGELVSPDGTVYALEPAPSEPDSIFANVYTRGYTVSRAPAGNWQVTISATVPAGYLLVASLDTPLQIYLQGLPQTPLSPGSTMTLNVVADAETAMPVVEQVAISIGDASTEETQAESASVTAVGSMLEYAAPTEMGVYDFDVTVTGQVDGSDFERSFVESLIVLSDENEISVEFLKGLLEQWNCESADCSELP